MPLRHPELFEPIFCRWSNAATVVRWIWNSTARAAAVAPRRYAAISSSMRVGPSLCRTCLTGRGWPGAASPSLDRAAQRASPGQAKGSSRGA
jgi:hypothetical protein